MDARLLIKVSQWYYEQGLTQETIARKLGTSRSTVSRLLSQSKKLGIVKIHITTEEANDYEVTLERNLEQNFGLDEAVVCDTSTTESAPFVASMGAEILMRSLSAHAVIGLSWGRSIAALVDRVPLENPTATNLTIVALSGGVGSTQPEIMSNSLVLQLATKLQAHGVTLDAPVIVQNSALLDTLVHEPSIAPVLSLGESAQIAVVGIGAIGQFSTLSTLKYLDPSTLQELTQLGAVGDICSRFYTVNGVPIDSDLDHRTLGIDFMTLKRIPRVIAVAWGPEKVRAIVGALRMGVLNVLITDRSTAKGVLDCT